jgi:hypothetical protein
VFTDDGGMHIDNGDLTSIINKSTHSAASAQIESEAKLTVGIKGCRPARSILRAVTALQHP